MSDSRFEPFIDYHKRFLIWWGLLLLILQLGSRRQLDFDLLCSSPPCPAIPPPVCQG